MSIEPCDICARYVDTDTEEMEVVQDSKGKDVLLCEICAESDDIPESVKIA